MKTSRVTLNRVTFSSLFALVFVLLAACSQAPAPQAEQPAEAPTLASQAVTTISDETSCIAAQGFYDAFISRCRISRPYTVNVGNTLELVRTPSLSGVDFDDLTNNGTLKVSDFTTVLVTNFVNNGTVELNWRMRLGYGSVYRNTGTITINSGGFLELFPSPTFSNEGTLSVKGGGNVYINSSATFTNSGTLSLGCGSTFDNQGTYTGTPPQYADCTAPGVTLEQAADQADPTSSSPISFTAVFSESVTGFEGADVSLSGTAGATGATVTEIAPNDGTTFKVEVSGMTGDGTVIASLAANVVTDLAGNSNTASTSTDNAVTYEAPDTTAPTASPSFSDNAGNPLSPSAAGWYNKIVNVAWNWSDEAGGSGLDDTNCETSPASVSSGRVTVSTTCTDVAGNQGDASVNLKVDTVAPTISYVGASPSNPNAKGWYKTNVTVSFTGTDALSGLASCPNKTVGEGLAKTATGVCTDNAGNRKSLISPAFNIDKTKPVVSVLMNGSIITNANSVYPTYALAQGVPVASCDTIDGVSGVATPAAISIVRVTSLGEVADANPPTLAGTYRAKCTGALDNADNTNARTVTFKVTK